MVTKMEKFTQKNYEELRAILSELHMHPGITIYKDAAENEILVKLYDWFNNNTYGFIEHIASEDSLVESIFHKIYLLVEKIRDGFFTQSEYVSALKRLSEYYDRIENTAKTFKLSDAYRDKTIKETVNDFLNYVNLSKKNIEDSILKFNETISQYNDQIVSSSKDINSRKRNVLSNIEETRINFEHTVDTHNKEITTIKQTLINQYDDLKKDHENFKVKIYKDINDIQNAVNREQLAAYFLNERKKLKGDIDIPVLIYTVLFEIFIFFITDTFTEFWHDFTLLKLIIFLVGIFIAILPFVKWGYYKFFEPETKNDVKPFDEIKAILTPYWCWLSLTFLGMFSIFTRAEEFYMENMLEILKLKPFLFLGNLPFFMILVWFTWFCSKQFSYTKQICDEYEYKYALSKSYLSYRDEAKSISLNDEDKGKYEAVIVSLLDSVIKNIATSPVKSVKPDCHTPFTEVFGSLRGIVQTIEDNDIKKKDK